jgi:CheY-like chemotaxis protein
MYRVLVVDDSMLIRHTVCRFLEERGFEVEAADDGLAAIEPLRLRQPDLIVTDMQMPGMSGGDLIAYLRARQQTAAIPVVVLTGRRSGRPTESTEGADFVIYKDIDIAEQLDRAITSVMGAAALPTTVVE